MTKGSLSFAILKGKCGFLRSKSSVKMLFFLGPFIVQERKWAADDGCTGKADTGNADERKRL